MSALGRVKPISNTILSFEKKMLLKKIEETTDLPIPNVHLINVIRLMRDENVNVKTLVASIEKDQALVAKILKLINSGFYSMKKSVGSVECAVGMLGLNKVKQIVYSASVMDLFSDEDKKEWDHAYSCSMLMGELIKQNQIDTAKSLPLAMLMHDIGKLVLKRFSPQKYKMAQLMAKNEHKPIQVAEETVVQISHAEAGSVLMEKWEMDDDIIRPVMYHHLDGVPPDHVLETALVQLVNWIDCTAREIPSTVQPSKELLSQAGFESFEKMDYVNYQKQLISQIESVESRLNQRYGISS